MAGAIVTYTYGHVVILVCACLAVWYITKQCSPVRVINVLQLKGRDCMAEFGCDELSTGDSLKVAGLGDTYTVNLYRNSY